MNRIFAVALLLTACSPTLDPEGNDSANLAGGAGNALRPTLAPVTNAANDAVLANPDVTVVVWPGDEAVGAEARAIIDAAMGTPGTWSVLAQYGVGAGSTRNVVVLPSPAPATIAQDDLRPLVDRLIAAGTLPMPTPSSLYMLMLSPTTTLSSNGAVCGDATQSCEAFQGFHDESNMGAVFAVTLRCHGAALTDDDTVTLTHELVEAATNPHWASSPAWEQDASGNGEVADLCNGATTQLTLASGQTVAATTLWSNATATQPSGNPCQPSSDPYYNIVMPTNTTIMLDANGNGETTIELDPFADDGIASIDYNVTGRTGGCGTTPTTITFSPDGASYLGPLTGTVAPGQKLTLRVRVAQAAPTDTSYGLSVYSYVESYTQVWFGTLTLQRATAPSSP